MVKGGVGGKRLKGFRLKEKRQKKGLNVNNQRTSPVLLD